MMLFQLHNKNPVLTEEARRQAHANGKEPFDYQTFVSLYPNDRGGKRLTGEEDANIISSYEEDYYLWHPEVKTISEFAKLLDQIDLNS